MDTENKIANVAHACQYLVNNVELIDWRNLTMVKSVIKATIFFKHAPSEVASLADAIIPMADSIRAVSTASERSKMRSILACEYFRLKEAERMHWMLLRAARYARAHLNEYFEILHDQVMYDATHLETTLDWYWHTLKEAVNETEPSQ